MKNKSIIYILIALILGLIIGYSIGGNSKINSSDYQKLLEKYILENSKNQVIINCMGDEYSNFHLDISECRAFHSNDQTELIKCLENALNVTFPRITCNANS